MANRKNCIPILQVVYDKEDDNLMLSIPPESEPVYRKQYGRIGQKLQEIAQLVQRQKWPHFMCDVPWSHVVPKNDIVEHVTSYKDFKCICNPMVDTVRRMVLHTAMDPNVTKFNNSPLAINLEWTVIEP